MDWIVNKKLRNFAGERNFSLLRERKFVKIGKCATAEIHRHINDCLFSKSYLNFQKFLSFLKDFSHFPEFYAHTERNFHSFGWVFFRSITWKCSHICNDWTSHKLFIPQHFAYIFIVFQSFLLSLSYCKKKLCIHLIFQTLLSLLRIWPSTAKKNGKVGWAWQGGK